MEKSLAAGSLGPHPWPSRGSDSLIETTLNSSWSAILSDSSKPKCLMFHSLVWFLLFTQYCLFSYQLPSLLTLQSSIFSRRRFCNNTDCFDLITPDWRLFTLHWGSVWPQCTDSLCLASTGLHWPGPTNEPPPWPPLLPGPGPLFTDMARSESEERHTSTEAHK